MFRSFNSSFRDYRAMAGPTAKVLFGVALALAIVSAVGFFLDDEPHYSARDGVGGALALLSASVATVLFGLVLRLVGKRHPLEGVNRRQATVAVVFLWLAVTVAGALPFWIDGDLGLADSLFESASGLSTTGATVMTDIERQSRSILLWRSVIQWLGGMGIVVLFVAVFPTLGVGGKRMVSGELPGTSKKGLRPRVGETALALWKLYVFFTLVVLVVYWAMGMGLFDAICHAFTTVSTGGFSTKNASIAGFELPAVEYACALFMMIGSVNYALYFVAIRNRSLTPFRISTEFRVFVGICVIAIVALVLSLLSEFDGDLERAFRHSLFAVGTTISSTGYGIDDPSTFPAPARMVVLLLMFVGGCAGSTAGGIKVERIVIVIKQAYRQIDRYTQPRVVKLVRMSGRPVDDATIGDVFAFMTVFFVSLTMGVVMFVLVEGYRVPGAIGATITCLSNMGPGLFHESANDNFAHFSDFTKLGSVVLMLLGRLEFFTLLVLLTPSLWRR